MTSVRSLRSVAESAPPRRSATMGVDNGRDIAARLRAAKLASSESSTALSALANLGVASRGSSPATKRTSGYFSSLRNLASLPSFSPPLSPSATRPAPTAAQKGKARASPPARPQSYLISRFVEPPPPADASHTLSVSPPAHLAGRTLSSANLALSRTQQKALLARDAPYYEFSPTKMSRQGSEQQPRMQSTGFVKEAERIERQYRAVEKWRDPLGESLERVLAVAKGKGAPFTGS